ncbi:MAG: FAD-dependent oxidoreductase [Pseudohongiellaceae bacterium]|nr:FAD-dependent oxidoreductase [Pseudohongiellaceae bacterium]
MKIAIIGSGISGLTCAYYLHKDHDIHLFESADVIGGHTATVDVEWEGEPYSIDTGFIVFNDWTYPNFIKLMTEIGVESRPSDMSFGVNCAETGLQYAGVEGRVRMFNSLFAQRSTILSPKHIGMLLDIVKFNKHAVADVESNSIDPQWTLRDYVQKYSLGEQFARFYLIPMASAIWSTSYKEMESFPMSFMLPFMYRHGLLSVANRPKWHTIKGGSSAYIPPLVSGFRDKIRLSSKVLGVSRSSDSVRVATAESVEQFDQVIFACHSDQALALLNEADAIETEILQAIRYQENEVVLHSDISVMPSNRRAWASWNYNLSEGCENDLPMVSYDMNRLMGLKNCPQFLVTLNSSKELNPALVHREFRYSHPVFTREGVAAQSRWSEINGRNKSWFCGAWWGKGFHEDGVNSALRVVEAISQHGALKAAM